MPNARLLIAVVLAWIITQPPAWADVLHLSNRHTLEGIIVRETASHVKVRIAWTGYVTIDREAIVEIVREDDKVHKHRLAQWREEHLLLQQRERERRAFEAAQRERGLVRYQGQWIAQEESGLIKEEGAQKEQELQEEQLQLLTQRIQALEEENRRLRGELDRRQQLIIPLGFLIHHHPHHQPNPFTDEQGNLIRVQEHEGHKFFTAPDGKHVDVKSHESHLAFTDEAGIHHDLTTLRH